MRLQGTSHPGRRGYGVRAGSSVARRLVRLTSRVELVRDAVAVRVVVQWVAVAIDVFGGRGQAVAVVVGVWCVDDCVGVPVPRVEAVEPGQAAAGAVIVGRLKAGW